MVLQLVHGMFPPSLSTRTDYLILRHQRRLPGDHHYAVHKLNTNSLGGG